MTRTASARLVGHNYRHIGVTFGKPWERIDTANPYVGRHRAPAWHHLVPRATIDACIDAEHDVGTRHRDGQLDTATCHDCDHQFDRYWLPDSPPFATATAATK